MAMTIGKWRRLQQTAGPNGTFYIAAIDHRGPLRRSLETESPQGKTNEALTALKRDIVRHLAPATSAVLLDPETAAGQCVADGSMVENWSVEKTVRMGASGVKMLLYYHPQTPQAGERESLVRKVACDCAQYDIPFFLEPLY